MPNLPIEHTDGDGQRVVHHGDRLSIYGSPSLVNDETGEVAIGADIPTDWLTHNAAVGARADALAKLTTTVREERQRWIKAQAETPSRTGGTIEALAWVEAQIRIAGLDDAAADATAPQIGAAGGKGEGDGEAGHG
jgi:hypothetical protein